MSKSMWIDAVETKPVISENDAYRAQTQQSDDVIIWIEGHPAPCFACYNHSINHWFSSMARGFDQSKVKYFAYIDNPYK